MAGGGEGGVVIGSGWGLGCGLVRVGGMDGVLVGVWLTTITPVAARSAVRSRRSRRWKRDGGVRVKLAAGEYYHAWRPDIHGNLFYNTMIHKTP